VSTSVTITTEGTYRGTIGEHVGCDKVVSSCGWIHFHRRDALRSARTTGDIQKLAHPFTSNKWYERCTHAAKLMMEGENFPSLSA
jgi:hypothetical protein